MNLQTTAMKLACIAILAIGILTPCSAQMKFVEDPAKGTLTLFDGQKSVLTYCFGDQLKRGLNPRHTRSCYIHPLFALDGRVLTDDFPKDHLHHHGVSWTWPVVKTRGRNTQTWHSVTPSLRQHFVRWVERVTGNSTASLRIETVWKLDGQETVARENVTLHVLPADDLGRAIDLELKIQAVDGTLELRGAPDQNKGYGGLNIRGAPMFKGAALTTDQRSLKKDSTNVPFRWADMSTGELGVAIFVSPDHPGFPTTWLIRNSYAGILNASWPGLTSVILQPGNPVILRYRLYIHRGDANTGRVRHAYKRYLKSL
ncbi:MAG: PmoA family protein [Candidatus Aminicenantes bacterium]